MTKETTDIDGLKQGFGIYIHWPFCLTKCPYCDFNSYVADSIDHNEWRSAYLRRIKYWADFIDDKKELTSIFFGGGTPSLMEAKTVEVIIEEIAKYWEFSNDIEITLEANPTSVETKKFKEFKQAGINRVSIGVQSLIDGDLKKLGRKHTANEAITAIDTASRHFDRYSFDLIYARDGQNINDWEGELKNALNIAGGHISLYQLTIEKGTKFYTLYNRGELNLPNNDEAASFYKITNDIMADASYFDYEVSNYAIKGEESQHNLLYWRYHDYLGIGAGAHGRISVGRDKFEIKEHRALNTWLQDKSKNFTSSLKLNKLTQQERLEELFLMGFRILEPISYDRIKEENVNYMNEVNFDAICNLESLGLLKNTNEAIAITKKGRLLLDRVLTKILS